MARTRLGTSASVTLNLQSESDDDEHFIQFHAHTDSSTIEISFPNQAKDDACAKIRLDLEDFCDAIQGLHRAVRGPSPS